MAPHTMTLTYVGAAMLWVGWFGFNAGSNLEASGGAMIATVNTFVATAAATLSWSAVEALTRGKSSMLGAASGMIGRSRCRYPGCWSRRSYGCHRHGCPCFAALLLLRLCREEQVRL